MASVLGRGNRRSAVTRAGHPARQEMRGASVVGPGGERVERGDPICSIAGRMGGVPKVGLRVTQSIQPGPHHPRFSRSNQCRTVVRRESPGVACSPVHLLQSFNHALCRNQGLCRAARKVGTGGLPQGADFVDHSVSIGTRNWYRQRWLLSGFERSPAGRPSVFILIRPRDCRAQTRDLSALPSGPGQPHCPTSSSPTSSPKSTNPSFLKTIQQKPWLNTGHKLAREGLWGHREAAGIDLLSRDLEGHFTATAVNIPGFVA